MTGKIKQILPILSLSRNFQNYAVSDGWPVSRLESSSITLGDTLGVDALSDPLFTKCVIKRFQFVHNTWHLFSCDYMISLPHRQRPHAREAAMSNELNIEDVGQSRGMNISKYTNLEVDGFHVERGT